MPNPIVLTIVNELDDELQIDCVEFEVDFERNRLYVTLPKCENLDACIRGNLDSFSLGERIGSLPNSIVFFDIYNVGGIS